MTPEIVAPAGWRAIDFISDLHLAEHTPRAFDAWAAHLRSTDADAVYILGDLFEAWVGDDMAAHGFEARCMSVLSDAARRIEVGFMAGNRDFLVGDALLESAGVTRLVDPTLIDAFGVRVLVSHGDALCLDDVAYQRFRSVARRPVVQRAFLGLPLSWRTSAARRIRLRSAAKPRTPRRSSPIDLDRDATLASARASDATTVVHGHTHAPGEHEIAPGVRRLVLTDWELDAAEPVRAEVLRWTRAGFDRMAPSAVATA